MWLPSRPVSVFVTASLVNEEPGMFLQRRQGSLRPPSPSSEIAASTFASVMRARGRGFISVLIAVPPSTTYRRQLRVRPLSRSGPSPILSSQAPQSRSTKGGCTHGYPCRRISSMSRKPRPRTGRRSPGLPAIRLSGKSTTGVSAHVWRYAPVPPQEGVLRSKHAVLLFAASSSSSQVPRTTGWRHRSVVDGRPLLRSSLACAQTAPGARHLEIVNRLLRSGSQV
jgi:hypothetical protein